MREAIILHYIKVKDLEKPLSIDRNCCGMFQNMTWSQVSHSVTKRNVAEGSVLQVNTNLICCSIHDKGVYK